MRALAVLLISAAAASFAPTPPGSALNLAEAGRRCFATTDARLVGFDPARSVYVRARTGETLELTGPSACLDVRDDPRVTLRALGPDGADVCLGQAAQLSLRSPAAIQRTCDVRVARIVPAEEAARLPNRRA